MQATELDLSRVQAAQKELDAAFWEIFREALPECREHGVVCQFMIRHLCEGVVHGKCGVGALIDPTEVTQDDFVALRRWADMTHKGELPDYVADQAIDFRPVRSFLDG